MIREAIFDFVNLFSAECIRKDTGGLHHKLAREGIGYVDLGRMRSSILCIRNLDTAICFTFVPDSQCLNLFTARLTCSKTQIKLKILFHLLLPWVFNV